MRERFARLRMGVKYGGTALFPLNRGAEQKNNCCFPLYIGGYMHTCSPFSQNLFSQSTFAARLLQLLKAPRIGSFCLLVMLCIAGSTAQAGTAGQATITFTIDTNQNGLTGNSSNCYYSDPNIGTIYNSGNISITINNTETETVIYQCLTAGSTYDYIQNLVNAINAHSSIVSASVVSDNYFEPGGSIKITAKTTGSSTNYPISVSTTWNTSFFVTDPNTGSVVPAFTGPAYVPSAPSALSGGS
jgi:hypothetical protein